MKKISLLIASLIFLCTTQNILLAQNDENYINSDHLSINFGLGNIASTNASIMFAKIFHTSFYHSQYLFSYRYIEKVGEDLNPSQLFGKTDQLLFANLREMSLLFGKKHHWASGYVSASIGISYNWGKRYLGDNIENKEMYESLGVPIDGQIFYNPVTFIGLGIVVSLGIMKQYVFIGYFVCIRIEFF